MVERQGWDIFPPKWQDKSEQVECDHHDHNCGCIIIGVHRIAFCSALELIDVKTMKKPTSLRVPIKRWAISAGMRCLDD